MFDRTMLYDTPAAGMPVVATTGASPARRVAAGEIRCAKCGGLMQTGFIVDRSYGSTFQEEWVQGRPRSFLYRVILRGARRQKVLTYRCVDCGYLESFARVATCLKCGCDLVGNVGEACPKCGVAIAAEQVAKRSRLSLEDAMRQAEILGRVWRALRLVVACLSGGLI
jgi:hypothetical protein